MKELLIANVAALLAAVFGSCPYSDILSGDILVADSYCGSASVCKVDNTCTLSFTNLSPSFTIFGNASIGNMSNYNNSFLETGNMSTINIVHMKLPAVVESFEIENVLHTDMGTDLYTFPDTLTALYFYNCSWNSIPSNLKWPANLKALHVPRNSLHVLPKDFPKTLKTLYIHENSLTNFTNLEVPSYLTFLNAHTNQITEIVGMNFTALAYLRISNNPITTFAFVELSRNLVFFDCSGCNLTNITITQSTFNALDGLKQWDQISTIYEGYNIDKSVSTDAQQCGNIGGKIQILWANTSVHSISVCVAPTASLITLPTTSLPRSAEPSWNITTIILGIVDGIGIIIILMTI